MELGTIIYDGECAYCRKQITKIQQKDQDHRFQYMPRQSKDTLSKFPQLTAYENMDGLRFVNHLGQPFIAADAVHQIFKNFRPHNYFTWLYSIPLLKQFFKLMYWIISKNRKRLAKNCEDNICQVPYAERKSS